jgi:hypothetical protein
MPCGQPIASTLNVTAKMCGTHIGFHSYRPLKSVELRSSSKKGMTHSREYPSARLRPSNLTLISSTPGSMFQNHYAPRESGGAAVTS